MTRPTLPAGARDLAAAREEGVEFEFWPRRAPSRPTAAARPSGRRLRQARPRQGRQAASERGSGFDVGATTVIVAQEFTPDVGDEDDLQLSPAGARSRPTTSPAARPTRACSPPATRSPAAKSAIHAVAGGKRAALADRRLAARRRPGRARGASWPSTPACPISSSSSDAEQARRRSAARLAERVAGVAQDGRAAEPAARADDAQGCARQRTAPARFDRGREGLQPGRRARPRPSAACSASARRRRLRSAAARRRVRHHRATSWSSKSRRVRDVEPQLTSIRSSAATWTAASPAAAACGSAATWPARPATTSPAGASP